MRKNTEFGVVEKSQCLVGRDEGSIADDARAYQVSQGCVLDKETDAGTIALNSAMIMSALRRMRFFRDDRELPRLI